MIIIVFILGGDESVKHRTSAYSATGHICGIAAYPSEKKTKETFKLNMMIIIKIDNFTDNCTFS